MYKINPSVELWFQSDTEWKGHVARAARICYASDSGLRTSEQMCEHLKKNGHHSVFRHASVYYVISSSNLSEQEKEVLRWIHLSPYVGVRDKFWKGTDVYFISTNRHFLMSCFLFREMFKRYECTLSSFVEQAHAVNFPSALELIRFTVCVTTQISTSRELNRTSPNSISEQSTRYVNFWKKGGTTICLPHWYAGASWIKKALANVLWKVDEWFYLLFLRMGMPPEDARTALSIDTATRVAYTYSVDEWRHIFDLRFYGSTGKPHPNAKLATGQVMELIAHAFKMMGGTL